MTRYRILVGPHECRVERNGVTSAPAPLTDNDGPEDVRRIAAKLYQTIFRIVAFRAWVRHRGIMAHARRLAAACMLVRKGGGDSDGGA